MTAEDFYCEENSGSRPLRAMNLLLNAVNLAPASRGGNLVLERSSGAPRSTEAGSTVARRIELEVTTNLASGTRPGSGSVLFERDALRLHAQITPTALEVVGPASGPGMHR